MDDQQGITINHFKEQPTSNIVRFSSTQVICPDLLYARCLLQIWPVSNMCIIYKVAMFTPKVNVKEGIKFEMVIPHVALGSFMGKVYMVTNDQI